ncbi:hypothetical protein QYF36_013655 [Acer negundo]|nr:hypothetical protein QYF36_013655 [Acer negundo]
MHPKSQEISTALLCTLVECWNALLEVKSCSNEIILFFLNGFTAQEGNILRRYCDASPSPMAVAPLPPPPPPHCLVD